MPRITPDGVTTVSKLHQMDERLVPRRNFHAPSWTTIVLFAISVLGVTLAINISDQADNAILASRRINCASQQKMNDLVILTFARWKETEDAEARVAHPPTPAVTHLRIADLSDFQRAVEKLPPIHCP